MIKRALISVAAVILAAVTLGACSQGGLRVGPLGNPDHIPGTQCTPLAGHATTTDGLESVQNHHPGTTATLTGLRLRKDHGLIVVRSWAVPTQELYGVSYDGPPPRGYSVTGFQWDQARPVAGTKVTYSTGFHRINLLVQVKLAAGRTRGRAAGIDVTYTQDGHPYLIPMRTALVVTTRRC